MANYGTDENWLKSYGGDVNTITEDDSDTKLDQSGLIKIKFSRPIVFPNFLIRQFDGTY